MIGNHRRQRTQIGGQLHGKLGMGSEPPPRTWPLPVPSS
jgi:hypothetical protein